MNIPFTKVCLTRMLRFNKSEADIQSITKKKLTLDISVNNDSDQTAS